MSWLDSIGLGGVGSKVAATGGSILNGVVIFLVILLVGGIIAIAAWLVISNMRYNKKIILLQKVNGRVEKVGTDKAIEMKYNKFGDTVFKLKKRKKFIPIPSLQTARKEFTFYIREDGEWTNIDYPDIDEQMKKMKVHYVDADLRLSRTAMYKNLKDRYDKVGFMEKYGQTVFNFVAIAIIVVGMIFLMNQMSKTAATINAGVDSTTKLLDRASSILSSLDNICSNAGYHQTATVTPVVNGT